MKLTRSPLSPVRGFALISLLCFIAGCATPPAGRVWVHETRSSSQMEEHLDGCKVNTLLLWPFDWASKCMRRRGYELNDIDARDDAGGPARTEE
ncbi:MAG TPA: hypothetical protein EYG54_09195 [Myxococcales bacterium]|nr:hypothetical protein [Myxococcales bacterium]